MRLSPLKPRNFTSNVEEAPSRSLAGRLGLADPCATRDNIEAGDWSVKSHESRHGSVGSFGPGVSTAICNHSWWAPSVEKGFQRLHEVVGEFTNVALSIVAVSSTTGGSVGDSYDNALAETIYGLYKAEVIHRRGPWRSFEAVEYATLEWVDWFNNRPLLEPIGNIPPAEAEERYYAMPDDVRGCISLNQMACGNPGAVQSRDGSIGNSAYGP